MFSHSAWLLLADLTVQLPVGACTLNSGKIAAFKNKIVQAGVFQMCFGDSPSYFNETSTFFEWLEPLSSFSGEDFSVLKISTAGTRCKMKGVQVGIQHKAGLLTRYPSAEATTIKFP